MQFLTFFFNIFLRDHLTLSNAEMFNWMKTSWLKGQKVFCMVQAVNKIFLHYQFDCWKRRYFIEKNFKCVFLKTTILLSALKLFSELLIQFSQNFYHVFVTYVSMVGIIIKSKYSFLLFYWPEKLPKENLILA